MYLSCYHYYYKKGVKNFSTIDASNALELLNIIKEKKKEVTKVPE